MTDLPSSFPALVALAMWSLGGVHSFREINSLLAVMLKGEEQLRR